MPSTRCGCASYRDGHSKRNGTARAVPYRCAEEDPGAGADAKKDGAGDVQVVHDVHDLLGQLLERGEGRGGGEGRCTRLLSGRVDAHKLQGFEHAQRGGDGQEAVEARVGWRGGGRE